MKIILSLLFFAFFLVGCFPSFSKAQAWQIEWADNLAQMNMEQRYLIGPDSLVITGVADFGRTPVNYLQRPLSAEEKKALSDFISGFDTDSLAPLYFHDYTGFQVINAENYPRSVDLSILKQGKLTQSKATNCWVGLFAQVALATNPVLPSEVRIKYEAESFEVRK